MSRLDSPHDRLLMRAILRSVLSDAMLARLDLGSRTEVAGSFVYRTSLGNAPR